jgi:tetratricopeptide (TPR) repeat protein
VRSMLRFMRARKNAECISALLALSPCIFLLRMKAPRAGFKRSTNLWFGRPRSAVKTRLAKELQSGIVMHLVPFWRTLTQAGFLLLLIPLVALSQPNVHSTKASPLLTQAKQAEAQGRFSEALADYEAALLSDPKNAQIALQIGLLKGEAGDFTGAVNAFRRTLEIQPNSAEAHYNLGLSLIASSRNVPVWTDALPEFRAAAAARPDYYQALNMIGVGLLESGNAAAAIPQLQAALKLAPNSAEIQFNLGRALEASGDTTNAYVHYLAAVQAKKPFPEAESALGSLLLAKGDVQGAAAQFQAAVSANPDDESARYKLARALRAQGKAAEAKVELKQAAMLIQKHSDAIMSSHLSNESLAHAKSGDLPGAIQLGRKALWLDPQNAIADYNLGLLLADAGNLDASIFEIRKAISLAPLNGAFYADFAKVQEKAGYRWTLAIVNSRRTVNCSKAVCARNHPILPRRNRTIAFSLALHPTLRKAILLLPPSSVKKEISWVRLAKCHGHCHCSLLKAISVTIWP